VDPAAIQDEDRVLTPGIPAAFQKAAIDHQLLRTEEPA
jgi:hypothetical protein